MKTINSKIESALTLNLDLVTTIDCPSLRNRMGEKLANLGAFFTLSSILDDFVYTSEDAQRRSEDKRSVLAEFMAYILDTTGLTDVGLQKAYADTFKYSKSRSFKEQTLTESAIEALKASGESIEDIERSLAITNESGSIRHDALKDILETNEQHIKNELVAHFNRSVAHATPTLENLPTWMAKAIAFKLDDVLDKHKSFLRNGVIKGISTSGNDLYIINMDILPKLTTAKVIDMCQELEAETEEPNQSDDGFNW